MQIGTFRSERSVLSLLTYSMLAPPQLLQRARRARCSRTGRRVRVSACSSDCIVQAAAAADRRVADLEIHLLYSIHSSRSWGVVLANYRLAHLLSSYSCWRFFL
jgi:hypothetical protein